MSVDFESNIEEEIAELRREIAAKGTSSKQGGENKCALRTSIYTPNNLRSHSETKQGSVGI